MKRALAALALAAALPAHAEVWGVVNTVSYHSDRSCYSCDEGKLNQANWGAGLEFRREDLALQVGGYRNSFGRNTAYLIGMWQPIKSGPASAGAFLGAATGYQNDDRCGSSVCPVAGFMFSITHERVGVNVMVVPSVNPKHTTVFGLQIKGRFV